MPVPSLRHQFIKKQEFEEFFTYFPYSGVPITRAGSIKRAGRIFLQILINEQVLIRASRLEKIKILAVKLQSGRNFHDIFKNEQALLRASRLENDQKFLVRACSRNRDTRVFKLIGSLANWVQVTIFSSHK